MRKYLGHIKKKSVKTQWAYSYLLILLIPIVLSLGYYYYSEQSAQQEQAEVVQENQHVLENLRTYVDGQLDDLISFYYFIATDANLSGVVSSQSDDMRFHRKTTEMLLELYDHYDSKELSYLIYLPERDYILWDGISYSSKICYDIKQLEENSGITYAEWTALLGEQYKSGFKSSHSLNTATFGNCIVYTKTREYKGRGSANVFISCSNSQIQAITDLLDVGVQVAVTSKNEVLFSTFEQNREIPKAEYGPQGSGFLKKTLTEQPGVFETDQYIGIQKASAKEGIVYYLFIPKAPYMSKHIRNRVILGISLLLILLLGVGGIYTFLKRNFRQVDKLLAQIGAKVQNTDMGNEFEQIEEIIKNLNEDNKLLQDNLMTQQAQLREKQLLALMQGRSVDEDKNGRLIPGLSAGENILLAGFEIPLPAGELHHDELLWFAVDNIFTELAEGERFYRVEDGKRLLYLFVVPTDGEKNWSLEIRRKMDYLCEFLEDKWGLSLTAAISGLEEEMERASVLYRNVLEAFDYKKLIGGSGVIDMEELEKNSSRSEGSISGTILQIALEKGDRERMQDASKELFASVQSMSFAIAKILVLNAFQSVLNFFLKGETTEDQRLYVIGYLNPMMEAEDITALKDVFDEMLNKVYLIVNGEDTERKEEVAESNGLVKQIKEYIEENYTDSGLNINAIADAFGKGARYVSRIFRDETQEGLLDYINRLRIEKAQSLLRTGRYSLEETGEMVGYASYKTFRRSFIKLVDMTPGKYVEQNSKYQ